MFRFSQKSLIQKISVWGGGTMGGGIAQVTAQAGIPATILEVSQERADISKKQVEASLARVAKKKADGDATKMKEYVDGVMKHLTWTTDEKQAADTDLVIEAVVEDLKVKQDLFARLDKLAPKEAIFVSNTSSLRVTDIASTAARKDRFGGLHFFSPVAMMKLVEVVRTEEVSPEVIAKLKEFCVKIKKVPVVTKDTKGFIVNRLLVPYQLEAVRLVERGVASFEDVDTAMKLGCGYPMGPFELSDSAGIDVGVLITTAWHKEFPDDPLFAPVTLPKKLFDNGKMGKKTGEGYYKYDSKGKKVGKTDLL
ncbi:short chain 3-hydroxyacyl-CoA dehydrogenase [Angomonas deanei]|uniref:3-hydroxyacyl-CoA dehydrogenase, NAD binding domain/3-hydroxyacyl-CoA dehydrogenase, C-terminal domain containing protein, putative n=1 Tax=Angomonas deanei TaxID=59799 RepID=A0A7G2C6Q7_9TRYP|nr:short chain 3-hydroxyacyl-CoA dehydrogenase [Angomonas deanei]CAD2213642.1 3-hydroxyacyl-CoA dehydrogenase, NAD binding domain/3-hydroxyacyl-CoA dehydrogenase, C-terminal domain containing protein, putative [Angomonas deanei]|eukprot:EPY39263.1 short chain 3-hydroxyacyl-CoA dehydrogenase [Angomonas deanei]